MKIYEIDSRDYRGTGPTLEEMEVVKETPQFYILKNASLAFHCSVRYPKEKACLTPDQAWDKHINWLLYREARILKELEAVRKKLADTEQARKRQP